MNTELDRDDVSKLEGSELDAAVAKAQGFATALPFSTDWAHGGPIIDRERIAVLPQSPRSFWDSSYARRAMSWHAIVGHQVGCTGPTALVAAMRAFVASKTG